MLEVECRLKPSRWFLTLFGLAVLLSCGILISLPCAWWFKATALIGIFFYCTPIFWRHGLLLGHQTVIGLRRQREGGWQIRTHTENITAVLEGTSTVTRWYSLLHFRMPARGGTRLSCLICQDSPYKTDHYRQLIVTLRMC